MLTTQMRFQGCLIGSAVGDALGNATKFESPGSFTPITDMVGGGPDNLKPGQWTDTTAMALCTADSLVDCRGFNAHDQMDRLTRWWREGYMSCTGNSFDVWPTIVEALETYGRTGEPFVGSTDRFAAGHGSLLRIAPANLFFIMDARRSILMGAETSRITHNAAACIDACRYFGGLIVGAMNGASKEELCQSRYAPLVGLWDWLHLSREIEDVVRGSFKEKEASDIAASGYVVKTLEAVLWAFYQSESFEEGCLMAANLGDHSDTIAAIFGQLAGAYYGIEGIPLHWRSTIAKGQLITAMANKLYAMRI